MWQKGDTPLLEDFEIIKYQCNMATETPMKSHVDNGHLSPHGTDPCTWAHHGATSVEPGLDSLLESRNRKDDA